MLNKILKCDKYIAVFSVLALFLIIGGTYAIASFWTTDDYNIALDSACMEITYTEGQDINKNVATINEGTYLGNNTITINSSMAFTTVSIELNEDCYDINGLATIEINVNSLPNVFKSGGGAYGALTYVVAEYDPTDYTNLNTEVIGDTLDIVARGSILNTGTIDAYTKYMEPGDVENYLVIFYSRFVNVLLSGSLSASISARVEQFAPTSISDFSYSIGTYNTGKEDYTVPEGKVLLTTYNGNNTTVNLPSTYTINGIQYDTAILSSECFINNTSITNVNFANNVALYSIEKGLVVNSAINLFRSCSSLVSVSGIPSSITNINKIFSECTSMVNFPIIPTSVTNMGSAFAGCTSLVTGPIIPSSVTELSQTFYGCTSLTGTVRINSSNIDTASDTFYGTSQNITIEVPTASTTYTTLNGNLPNNVTMVTY